MYNTAPDTPSPIYPDRLIRPLPKRTLRSRLSSDAADSILYPPTPPATQLFYGSGADTGEAVNESKIYVQQSDGPDPTLERDPQLLYENGVDLESGDEDGPVVVRRSAGFRGLSLSPSAPQPLPSNGEGPPTKTSAAGPDGYDAFENTNNKKKRKIPTPGSLGSHHSTLSPEFSSMGLTSSAQTPPPQMDGSHVSTFYGTGSPASPVASGHSGSGRGRLARHPPRNGTGRVPPTGVHAQAGLSQGRVHSRRDGLLSSPGPAGMLDGAALEGRPTHPHSGDATPKSEQGIISAAIANAAAAAFSSPPRPDNVSMLEQGQPTTPTKTQFTFTCESDSSKGMAMQAQNTYQAQHRSSHSPTPTAPNLRAFSTQGTQTSPPNASHMNPPAAAGTEAPPAGRKKKRSPGSMYAMAARQRKVQQQYTNLQHPPSLEDIWICEFCEYESIFGRPPEALIRQYEIKDRKERKRLAEKKRLLEKAKMKGRKNKKATKNAAKNAAGPPAAYEPGYDRSTADPSSMGPPAVHEDDECLAHEHEDENVVRPPPPPAPPAPPPAALNSPQPPQMVKGASDGGSHRPP